MACKAVFLDRDNTLIEDPGYISDPKVVTLLPGVELALKSLTQCGYKLVVVTIAANDQDIELLKLRIAEAVEMKHRMLNEIQL